MSELYIFVHLELSAYRHIKRSHHIMNAILHVLYAMKFERKTYMYMVVKHCYNKLE